MHATRSSSQSTVSIWPVVAIKDEVVWAIAQRDAPVLREECLALIDDLELDGKQTL
jgi:hypothetical protein